MAHNTSVPDNAIYEDNRSSNITHPSSAFSSTLSSYNVASDMDDKITDEYDEDFVVETNITTRTADLSEETAWPYTWDIFHLASFATVLLLVLLSFIINSIACVTVLRHSGLRRSGYFRLHIIFLIINFIYFVFTCPPRATYATTAIFNHLGVMLPGSTFLSMYPWLLQANTDLLHCLLGLQVWLLCGLTIDCRMSMSWSFHNRERFITGTRLTFAIMSFVIGTAAMAVISVLRQPSVFLFGHSFADGDEPNTSIGEETMYKVVIIYTIFILVFTVLPIFMVVLIGVSNCISFSASSRKWKYAQRLAIQLDRRYNVATLILLALMLVHFTRKMSEEVDVSSINESEEDVSDASLIVSDIVHLMVDVMMIVFPILLTTVLGKLSCCCLRTNRFSEDGQIDNGVNKMT